MSILKKKEVVPEELASRMRQLARLMKEFDETQARLQLNLTPKEYSDTQNHADAVWGKYVAAMSHAVNYMYYHYKGENNG